MKKIILAIIIMAANIVLFSNFPVHAEGILVAAGGNESATVNFLPREVTINVGDTVKWYNPTPVLEPHTATFMSEGKYFATPKAPFLIQNVKDIVPLNNASNVEVNIVPSNSSDGPKVMIGDNARSSLPNVIGANNDTATYLPLNSEYIMKGDEKYINSGWMWPKDMIPPGASPITTFSVTFEKEGTYDFICVIHPWMTNKIIVNE
jgi:plastocyanin